MSEGRHSCITKSDGMRCEMESGSPSPLGMRAVWNHMLKRLATGCRAIHQADGT